MKVPSCCLGLPVVASVPVTEYPDNTPPVHSEKTVRVICEDTNFGISYIVWTLHDTHGEWIASNGHYDLSYPEALTVLARI